MTNREYSYRTLRVLLADLDRALASGEIRVAEHDRRQRALERRMARVGASAAEAAAWAPEPGSVRADDHYGNWLAYLDACPAEDSDYGKLDEMYEAGQLTTAQHAQVLARIESALGAR